MHARVLQVSVNPQTIDAAVETYAQLGEALQSQPGFVGAYLLGDRGDGSSISITMWESEADEQATVDSGFLQEQLGKFAQYLTAEPVRSSMEVLHQV